MNEAQNILTHSARWPNPRAPGQFGTLSKAPSVSLGERWKQSRASTFSGNVGLLPAAKNAQVKRDRKQGLGHRHDKLSKRQDGPVNIEQATTVAFCSDTTHWFVHQLCQKKCVDDVSLHFTEE